MAADPDAAISAARLAAAGAKGLAALMTENEGIAVAAGGVILLGPAGFAAYKPAARTKRTGTAPGEALSSSSTAVAAGSKGEPQVRRSRPGCER